MSIRRILRSATGVSRGLMFLALASCDTSPDVVSFNTPELCEPERTDIATFTEARQACDEDCQICIATTLADHALTYAIARDDNCVCPAPVAVEGSPTDAGFARTDEASVPDANTEAPSDASAASSAGDAGSELPGAPNIAADGCSSLLNQSLSGAAAYCDAHTDCNVCVERVDFDNEPRRYMAHVCGCPSPYRLE